MCFANIFSKSIANLFIPLTVSFTEQKFFILMRSNSSSFSLMDRTFGVVYKNSLPNPKSHRFSPVFFFLNFFFLIYLFMAVLGLRFCARAFSSCGKWGSLFIAVHGPLTIAASIVAEHRLQTRRLSNCGSRAQLLCGMWDPPRPGLEPVSPAFAGRFSTTAPPGKPLLFYSRSLSLFTFRSTDHCELIFCERCKVCV